VDLTRSLDRGWNVAPCFVGENSLDPAIFDELQHHPLIPGDSGWGIRNLLYALILSTRPRIVLEVGAQIGAASLVIGAALRLNGFGKSYHLEPQDEYYRVLRDFISRAHLDKFAYPMQASSTDPLVGELVGDSADLIFLDANHDYSRAHHDLVTCSSFMAPQGVMLIDDVGHRHSAEMCQEDRGGVRRALLDFVAARPEFSVIFLEPPFWLNPCGLAVLARTPEDQYSNKITRRFGL